MSYIKNPVQIATRTIISEDKQLKVDYPVVLGLENKAVQEKINNTIRDLVYKLIKDQGYYEYPVAEVMGWYEIKNNQRGILSLSLGNYTYPEKAAHGMTVIKSLTFNVEDGKLYSLSDLFKPGSDYVAALSKQVAEQIKERQLPLLGEFKGIAPEQDYYIADKSLVIYFQLYDISPYYVGLPHFPISVYTLSDIYREDGPLGLMAM